MTKEWVKPPPRKADYVIELFLKERQAESAMTIASFTFYLQERDHLGPAVDAVQKVRRFIEKSLKTREL